VKIVSIPLAFNLRATRCPALTVLPIGASMLMAAA